MANEKKTKRTYRPEDSLKKSRNTKVRSEFIDYDYTDQLDEESLKFLAKFNNEYYGAAVSKTETGRVKAGHLHKTKALAKDVYDSNNRRNNDVLGVTRANRLLSDIEGEIKRNDGWYVHDVELEEKRLNEALDNPDDELLTKEEYEKVKNNLTMEMQLFYEVYFSEDMELNSDEDWD